METKSQQPKEQEGAISMLNGFIEVFNLAKEISSNTPAKAVFGSVNVLLAMIRVGLPAFRWSNTDSLWNAHRTRWPTKRITWNSGWRVPTSVQLSSGGLTGRAKTISMTPCVRRSNN